MRVNIGLLVGRVVGLIRHPEAGGFKMKVVRLLLMCTLLAVLGVMDCAAAGNFYAYYTRFDYDIPIDKALYYIPQGRKSC